MKIENKSFEKERSLYNIKDTDLINVSFSGKEDGESPLKECSNISLDKCLVDLRYACWHDNGLYISGSTFTDKCRAPLWYSKKVFVDDCSILGVKSFRESKNILVDKSKIVSPEVFWRCKDINVLNSTVESEYGFFESKDILLKNITFKGKYSFQYVKNLLIEDSSFDTKDAFWHAKGVTIFNSYIKGEYIGWYSNRLTLINCVIESHQPFCYCKKLNLINCEFKNSDLAFEYSKVKATIKGHLDSIKNPRSGKIVVDSLGELVHDDDKFKGHAKVKILSK